MARLFADAPQAIGETLRFLEGARFSLDELRGDYPEELREGFATPQAALEFFAREGAKVALSERRSGACRKSHRA